MATVTAWCPFGVSLNITATGSSVTRKSATQFTVKINASWQSYYSGAKTNYGMSASSGGGSATINPFGTKATSGNGSFTGTYSISGNGAQTKTITVTFKNFNSDNGDSATKNVTFNVSVPAWTSYTITYNANGGSGAPSPQTKWKDQVCTLSSVKPTRTGHSFLGWSLSSTATTASYSAGQTWGAANNANYTLYAVWKANTYTVSYNANGGTGAPANQTKTYGQTLTLSSAKPTREDYNFLGWSTSASSTAIAYNAGSSYTSNAAITLYAVWELAYVKPSISNVVVERCSPVTDEDGNVSYELNDEGTYAVVSFDWETFIDIALMDILSIRGGVELTDSYSVPDVSGTSGKVTAYVGNGLLDPEVTYRIQIVINDTKSRYPFDNTLPSARHPIDVLAKGLGIAFNKSAELEGVADMNYLLLTRAGFQQPVLESGSDLNDEKFRIPNKYTVKSVQTAGYKCGEGSIPISSGTGMLTIESFGPEGQVKQTLEVCHKTNPLRFERYYYQTEWGNWYEAGGYKSAITVKLSSDVTLGVVNSYTQIPFNSTVTSKGGGLSLSDNYVKIGTGIRCVRISGQLKINCGATAGLRHARIAKISGGNTSHIAWNHIKMVASDQHIIPFTPVIANVSEGDLLYVVFHTPDSADVNYAGTATNGIQTYLTVESI